MPRRTKRRYAHELYPHAEEGEARSLAVEVPYLYARMTGFEVDGTSWFDKLGPESGNRINQLIDARKIAFLADALNQGMGGQEAWDWVTYQASDETGEIAWDRATHYGVDPDLIKPYPCGPEPDYHNHVGGGGTINAIQVVGGPESECSDCTEEVD